MKVYCEASGETTDVEASSAQVAAEIAHGRGDEGSGCNSYYRVERRPGQWVRFAVSMEMQPVFTTREKGTCDPPSSEETEEDGEEMGDE